LRGLAAPLLRLSFRVLSCRPVGEDEDAVRADLLRVHELHGLRLFRIPEETLAFAHDDRENHQAVLVDEIAYLVPVRRAKPYPQLFSRLPDKPESGFGDVLLPFVLGRQDAKEQIVRGVLYPRVVESSSHVYGNVLGSSEADYSRGRERPEKMAERGVISYLTLHVWSQEL
jgi:hypothetical protein